MQKNRHLYRDLLRESERRKSQTRFGITDQQGIFMPGLPDWMRDRVLKEAVEQMELDIASAKEKGYGILGYISDCIDEKGIPKDNEHIQSVLKASRNPWLLKSIDGIGVRLRVSDIGSIGDEDAILWVHYHKWFTYGGRQSELLEGALIKCLKEKFPGVIVNVRESSHAVVKGRSMVTLTIFHFG